MSIPKISENMYKHFRSYRVAISVFILILAGCQTPPAPTVRPFGDNQAWITVENVEYIIGGTTERIVVPKGFVTDFASIPQALWSFGLSPHGQYSRAALIHDYLYWSQGCSRPQSDRLLVIAMKESEVGSFDEFAIYQGVKLGGGGPWEENAKEREEGLPRVVPEEYIRPANPNVNWADYRVMLVKEGVKDPVFQQSPSYCTLGDSTDVRLAN